MAKRRVVITGMGVITPLGTSVEKFWNGLIAGKGGIGSITRFDSEGFDTCFAGECWGFEPTRWIDRKQIKRLDRFAQLALAAKDHSKWMLATNIFSHDGIGGSQPWDRMENAGYDFTGSWLASENLAWSGYGIGGSIKGNGSRPYYSRSEEKGL